MAPSSWFLKLVLTWSIVQMSYSGVIGSCMDEPLVTEPPRDPTIPIPTQYCLYNHNIQFRVGTKLRIRNHCVDCTCHKDGMTCCGYGTAGGEFEVEDHCKVVAPFDDCVEYTVRKDDEALDCDTGEPIVRKPPPKWYR